MAETPTTTNTTATSELVKRPAITAPVRRGARVVRDADRDGRLNVDGPIPQIHGTTPEENRDVKRYFEWNRRMMDFLADQAEDEAGESGERFDGGDA